MTHVGEFAAHGPTYMKKLKFQTNTRSLLLTT